MKAIVISAALIVYLGAMVPAVDAHHETGCSDTTPDFTDSCIHEYLLYNMDQPDIDVLILPSSSPYALRDLALMEQSIQQWDDGINALAPSWLAGALNIKYYTVGVDVPPAEALWDPEIVVVPAEFNPFVLFGIGLEPWNFILGKAFCHGRDPFMMEGPAGALQTVQAIVDDPAFHQHEGAEWGMFMAECNAGGTTCFAVNTNFLWLPDAQNRRDMYDLNSHEFGHCLGIGHVGDALDFSASTYPVDDIMSYSSDGDIAPVVLCVSTLNIRALEHIYGDMILGGTTYPEFPAGLYVHMTASSWSDYACDEPTATPTTLPDI